MPQAQEHSAYTFRALEKNGSNFQRLHKTHNAQRRANGAVDVFLRAYFYARDYWIGISPSLASVGICTMFLRLGMDANCFGKR